MSAPILGQVQGDFLQVIEELSSLGAVKCVCFNRRGTRLAVGFSVGACVIWGFQTKKIIRVLWDEHHTVATTSICWSKNNRCLLVSDIEKSLILWDADNGNILARSKLQHIPMQVHLHCGSAIPSICLVCPLSSPPLIVDFNSGSTIVLPIALPDGRKKSGEFIPVAPTAACFNKYGDLVYMGNNKGEILLVDHENTNIRAIIPVPGGAMIKNIGFSGNWKYLHINSTDGIIRIYRNLLPIENSLLALNDATRGLGAKKYENKHLRAIGSRCLDLLQEFPDSIRKGPWKVTCVSHDCEWVAGACTIRNYEICVWDRTGRCVKVIEGANEMLIDVKWHPVRPIILAISRTGSLYSWGSHAEEREDRVDPMPIREIETSQSRSHLKKAGEDKFLKNLASGSLEEVGIKTYLRRKRKVSQPQADDVMKPPPPK